MKNRVFRLLVGNGLNANAFGITAGLIGETSATAGSFKNLTSGGLMILDDNLAVIATEVAAAAYGANRKFYIAQGTSDVQKPILSGPLTKNSIVQTFGVDYDTEKVQISQIGYNGTDGALVAVNNATYKLTVVIKDNLRYFEQRQTRRVLYYKSDASASQDEIAEAFIALVNKDEILSGLMTADKLSSGSDRGIRLTGKTVPFNKYNQYSGVMFEASFIYNEDVNITGGTFATTTKDNNFRTSQAYDPGAGTYKQMYEVEDELLTYGEKNKRGFPVIDPTRYISSTGTYAQVVIQYDFNNKENIEGTHSNPQGIIIAINQNHPAASGTQVVQSDNGVANSFLAVLNDMLGTAYDFI